MASELSLTDVSTAIRSEYRRIFTDAHQGYPPHEMDPVGRSAKSPPKSEAARGTVHHAFGWIAFT
jgi:hypothetical protein